jgi:hypothetical protein
MSLGRRSQRAEGVAEVRWSSVTSMALTEEIPFTRKKQIWITLMFTVFGVGIHRYKNWKYFPSRSDE